MALYRRKRVKDRRSGPPKGYGSDGNHAPPRFEPHDESLPQPGNELLHVPNPVTTEADGNKK